MEKLLYLRDKTTLKKVFIFIFILGIFSCSKHDDSDQGVNEIRLEFKTFHPFQLRIPVGTTVLFNNTGGGGSHRVNGNLFDSGKIEVEDSFSYTFTAVGTHSFFCAFHTNNTEERITIVVE